jgi:hypothetical protein
LVSHTKRRTKIEEVEGSDNNLYPSANTVRAINSRTLRRAGHDVGCTGEMRNEQNSFVEKHERKRPLRRPRCRWEDKIRAYLKTVGWESVEWMYLAQYRVQWLALQTQ